ncbi:hypothetical protein GCM10025867_48400 (plasmid) [Frondihabitans sucicola]|uniref:NUDIX hydrolase n=1 Tax=Frondihabitans sucicola TaxID=1268041 RepID=A0ABM8GW36_9MICO|nr:hypothetical protein [Frondihabitans sucicola]BDZ52599.1 hypothetical protein GCM10025867_48400 [Frondihabitans sucicola]
MTPAALPEQPLIAVDVVPIRYSRKRGFVELFTGRRLFEPALGKPALPGVLLGQKLPHPMRDGTPGERIESTREAAYRALRTKIGAGGTSVRGGLFDIGIFEGLPGDLRDPRGDTISIARLAVLKDNFAPGDDEQTKISPFAATGLPFDHDRIVDAVAVLIDQRLLVDRDLTNALLPDAFTLGDIQAIYGDMGARITKAIQAKRLPVSARPTDPADSLRVRRLERTGWFEKGPAEPVGADDEAPRKGRGRPQATWRWA